MEKITPPPEIPAEGTIKVVSSPNPRFEALGYSVLIRKGGLRKDALERFGHVVGSVVGFHGLRSVAMPLVGYSNPGLSALDAIMALDRGFSATAPRSSSLVISVRSASTYQELVSRRPPAPRDDVADIVEFLRRNTGPDEEAGRTKKKSPRPPVEKPPATAKEPKPAPPGPAAPTPPPPPPPPPPSTTRSGIFISYSRADARWLGRLRKHLRPLEREGLDVWDDTRLKAGGQWRKEIREALAKTRVAVLLISADFLASDFIATDELPPLLQAAEEDGATILPVIVSPSRFERTESLSRFLSVNDPAKPLVEMRRASRERAFDRVARAVEDALKG